MKQRRNQYARPREAAKDWAAPAGLNEPVTFSWLLKASNLAGRSLHTGIALWHVAGRTGSLSIRLGNKACQPFGLARNSKNRALVELALAGLVRVEHKRGEAPVVTILVDDIEP